MAFTNLSYSSRIKIRCRRFFMRCRAYYAIPGLASIILLFWFKMPLKLPTTPDIPLAPPESIRIPASEDSEVIKIVFWTPFLKWDSNFGLKKKRFTNDELGCIIRKTNTKCEFSYYKEELPSANLVFTFFSDWAIWHKDHPSGDYVRPRDQLWVFFENEAPPQAYHWNWNIGMKKKPYLKEWNGLFNLTMSYRLDSDIYAPYGAFLPKPIPDMSLNYDRDDYIKAMIEAGLKVEYIGNCHVLGQPNKSPLSSLCPRKASDPTKTDECYPALSKRYAFFLAFENSICTDYITEKFHRGSRLDMIPVVLNGGNMSAMAPEHSHINAGDFHSPRHLVEYLQKVVSNQSLYNSYFKWKPYYDVVDLVYENAFSETLCMLCDKSRGFLEKAKTTKMIVNDIEDWWITKGNCKRGLSLQELREQSSV